FFHAVAGLDRDAAGVEGNSLADQSEHGFFGCTFGFIPKNDQGGRFIRTLCYSPERTHLQFFDLVGAINFNAQVGSSTPDFLNHLPSPLGKYGWGHAVAGLVDEFAGEILRLANDATFVERHAQARFVLFLGSNYGNRVDVLVFAIALVSIG